MRKPEERKLGFYSGFRMLSREDERERDGEREQRNQASYFKKQKKKRFFFLLRFPFSSYLGQAPGLISDNSDASVGGEQGQLI